MGVFNYTIYWNNKMKFLFLLFITISSVFLSACAKKQIISPQEPIQVNPIKYQSNQLEVIPYDRYTLVNVGASDEQRLVLIQIIDVSIPRNITTTVSDGMNYLLKQSGFALCQDNVLNQSLFNKPLPAIQYKLGPIRLGDALQIMAGPAFELIIDNLDRNVCFQLAEGYSINRTEYENNAVKEVIYE